MFIFTSTVPTRVKADKSWDTSAMKVSPLRVSRRRHPIEVEAGPYRVSGTVHLPIGADPRRYVATTGRRWLPLTDCTVSAPADEWAVDVVIVNLDHASRRETSSVPPKFG